MIYVKVKWLHEVEDTPILLYSELDHNRYEVRKVEAYSDGRLDYADQESNSGHTKLGIEPIPSIDDIAKDPQFIPENITKKDFDEVWTLARAR